MCYLEAIGIGKRLLEWDEPGRVGGSDTGSSVFDRLVRNGKLPQVVSDHLRLYSIVYKSTQVVFLHDI